MNRLNLYSRRTVQLTSLHGRLTRWGSHMHSRKCIRYVPTTSTNYQARSAWLWNDRNVIVRRSASRRPSPDRRPTPYRRPTGARPSPYLPPIGVRPSPYLPLTGALPTARPSPYLPPIGARPSPYLPAIGARPTCLVYSMTTKRITSIGQSVTEL